MASMASRSFLFALIYSLLVAGSAFASDSAWNGHTPPGSTEISTFTPYYVAPGTKSYDSSSPLIHYTGQWSQSRTGSYIHGSVHTTLDHQATATFTFTGTGIEWFGTQGRHFGRADVYINGELVQTIDNKRDYEITRKGQRVFWHFGLAAGKHVLKIRNAAITFDSQSPNLIDIAAFVVTRSVHRTQDFNTGSPAQNVPSTEKPFLNLMAASSAPSWRLVQKGSTGVAAMQIAVVSDTHVIVVDKVEHNLVDINGHPAWAALYNMDSHGVKPLTMKSNSFCAGGAFLRNGKLINVGGNPVVEDRTAPADFGDENGLQAIRVFDPCDSESADGCDMSEDHSRMRMASPRWYNTVLRISDGSAMIIGGSKKGGWINNATTNNPSYEYWPPKSIHKSNGMPIHSPFLLETLNSNLFPIAFSLPDGTIFLAANNDAMIYDWTTNKERRLPSFPNGVRVTYPMTGTALLLPLSPENNYTPEVLICGGSTIDDHRASYDISSQEPASAQCSRMVLSDEGISNGWQIEQMPEARLMPDAILLPTGQVLIVNGAGSGVSGYGNTKDQVGSSNADRPVLTPVLYDPTAQAGNRFTSEGMPTNIMIAGSNPNLDRSEVQYGTEYRVEWLSPPYMDAPRPALHSVPKKIGFGKQIKVKVDFVKLVVLLPVLALMDLGYVTHAVHANSRLVNLVVQLEGDELVITGPPNGKIYPPGPAFLYVLEDGIPSSGKKIMVGDGKDPEVDHEAWNNVLKNTSAH
ncbi:copper radical oxidase [Mucidula mucida]|nr:copper radical oxidase [Mucidula mucida]